MKKDVIVVSGLPRSGTSLMMQMLAAAGVPIQQDGVRVADESNERGYFEWERIKQLPRDPGLIAECEGKAVKVISSLLMGLPDGFAYQVVFLQRDLADVAASQGKMIARMGTRGGQLSSEQMVRALESHRAQVYAWLKARREMAVQIVEYERLMRDPLGEAVRVSEFLGLHRGAVDVMADAVDAGLWHAGR